MVVATMSVCVCVWGGGGDLTYNEATTSLFCIYRLVPTQK